MTCEVAAAAISQNPILEDMRKDSIGKRCLEYWQSPEDAQAFNSPTCVVDVLGKLSGIKLFEHFLMSAAFIIDVVIV